MLSRILFARNALKRSSNEKMGELGFYSGYSEFSAP